MKNFRLKISPLNVLALLVAFMMTSCVNDLEREPITDVTSNSVYKDFANYKNTLAKLYGGLAVGGQTSGDGSGDVADIDGGMSNYLRLMFYMQNIPTDEAVIGWNDGSLPTFNKMTWSSANEFNNAMYYRIYTEIAFCNEFLRNTTDEKLAANNITGANLTEAKHMRAEARFLRAQSYYHALDLYGNVPLVKEDVLPGTTLPQQIKRAELFKFVEAELLAAAQELKQPKTNEYGRVDQAAAWTLLAKLYLNAEVYAGENRNTDCITYCNKVINAGYALKSDYASLFLADNNVANSEVIFPIVYDGVNTQTNGGTSFLVHASIGGKMNADEFGVNGGWGGIRTTKAFVALFAPGDKRGRFFTDGQKLEIEDLGLFTDGYAFIKYKNVTSKGAKGSDANWVEADLQLYRLADVYLMYAEAVKRGGAGGNQTTALGYLNQLRARAGLANIDRYDLDYILDERARELSWELTRRTDLIRFNKFTTAQYLWPWKGGVKDGKAVEDFRNLYPIPVNDLVVNPNLTQNPGY